MRKQQGVSFVGFIIIAMAFIFAALLVMKVFPAYVDYYSVKKAIDNVVRDENGSDAPAVRSAFDKQILISNIQDIGANDLRVQVIAGNTKVAVDYEKVVPLFGNVSLLFNFKYEKMGGGSK
ncbi:protein of unknown function [Andreprevotia lacus DSM 23236]|jgi:Flp pilus assembly protein TadG|uniref:DUF4845 domain-containing protein n=1 Tax=Andreprevotia lacus DSM 23236 TaxID=1121001 RepID=A0A1W1XN56_9NEIS|nr:DUF4845 domain-containing protein [Andreprevotia lacus]SMC25294.1 protein of unknown function [Andreprevotia lacus DSM 23236]